MTRQEAVERLKSIKSLVDKYDDVVALREAVKALEQELCEDANANQHNSNVLNDVGQHKNALEEDAISRQAAIDAVAFGITYATGVNMETGEVSYPFAESNHELRKAIHRICELPLVTPKQRWIPVSERLPEEYGEYLITWTTSQSKRPLIGISEGEITSEYDHEYNRFKFEWLLEDYVKNYPDVKVLAWMPLPKPFEPQESGGENAEI